MEKRKWVYLQQPKVHEMASCFCGNEDTQWSEYAKHLWCDKCQKDFIPSHGGIFDGPIAFNTARILGITFDRFNLESNQVELVDNEEIGSGPVLYVVCHKPIDIFSSKKIPIDIKKYTKEKDKPEIKKGVISFFKGSFSVELLEEFSEDINSDFTTTIKMGYPDTKTFYLYLDSEDKKNFVIRKTKVFMDFQDFILVNELNYDLGVNASLKKTNKV